MSRSYKHKNVTTKRNNYKISNFLGIKIIRDFFIKHWCVITKKNYKKYLLFTSSKNHSKYSVNSLIYSAQNKSKNTYNSWQRINNVEKTFFFRFRKGNIKFLQYGRNDWRPRAFGSNSAKHFRSRIIEVRNLNNIQIIANN